MWTCLKCGEEGEADFDVCWSCGASKDGVDDPGFVPERDGIVTAADFQAKTGDKINDKLVVAATYWNAAEANLGQNALQRQGIRSFLDNELLVMTGLINVVGGIKLLVADKDLLRARMVLPEIEDAKTRDVDRGGEEEEVDDRSKPG